MRDSSEVRGGCRRGSYGDGASAQSVDSRTESEDSEDYQNGSARIQRITSKNPRKDNNNHTSCGRLWLCSNTADDLDDSPHRQFKRQSLLSSTIPPGSGGPSLHSQSHVTSGRHKLLQLQGTGGKTGNAHIFASGQVLRWVNASMPTHSTCSLTTRAGSFCIHTRPQTCQALRVPVSHKHTEWAWGAVHSSRRSSAR